MKPIADDIRDLPRLIQSAKRAEREPSCATRGLRPAAGILRGAAQLLASVAAGIRFRAQIGPAVPPLTNWIPGWTPDGVEEALQLAEELAGALQDSIAAAENRHPSHSTFFGDDAGNELDRIAADPTDLIPRRLRRLEEFVREWYAEDTDERLPGGTLPQLVRLR